MVSPDQAEKAADSVIEPARQELREKQQRLEARENARRRRSESPLFPAGAAAGATLVALEYFAEPPYAFIVGLVFGWVVGLAMRRSTQ